MKTFIILFVAAFTTPLLAEDVDYRPTEQCLADIGEAMFKLGTSEIADENEISFEAFLGKQGNRYTFIYYKLDSTTRTLDITGRGAVDLRIKHSLRNDGLTDIDDCEVSNPQILDESR